MKKEYNLEYQSIVKNRRGANISIHILYEGFRDIKFDTIKSYYRKFKEFWNKSYSIFIESIFILIA